MCRCLSAISCVLATLSFVTSNAAFIYFTFFAINIHASAFALFSVAFSICAFHLHTLYLKRTIRDWYNEENLEAIASFALVMFLLSNLFFGVYLSLGIVRHQGYTFQTSSYYISATFSAFSSIWAFIIFMSALFYRREQLQYPVLLCHNRSYP